MDLCDTTYQQICSARTVQSDTKGFFHEFYLEIKHSCGDKWLKNYFAKLKSDQARILSIFSDREICDPVLGILENVQAVYKEKDALFSAERRAQAEKYHLIGDLSKALAFANLAVMRAPAKDVDIDVDNGLSLALAFWKRALVLIDLGEGEAALSDLKLAAANGIESKQNVNYYLKMAKAYACMGETVRMEISLNIAEKLSYGSNQIIDIHRKEIASTKITEKKIDLKPPRPAYGENAELHGSSNLIQLAEATDKGHFIVAKENLKTGDVVLAEQPVAACLLPNFYGSHCHNCFFRLKAPVPCLKCSGVAFCSTQCMDEAARTYHRFECEFMDLFIGSGMSILCYIALRIFTQSTSIENGLSVANNLIANLCAHTESRHVDDFLQRSLMAGFLLRCLQKAQYFGRRKTEGVNPTAQELQVGAALLGVLQVLQFNAHEIYETMMTADHRFEGSKVIYVGAGIYATGSYFNHECWPSIARYFVGKTIVLTCIRPHKPNEMIAENYGPVFIKKNLKDRQRALRARYLFDCNCDACRENWPTLQKLDKLVRFRCTTFNCANLLTFPKDLGKEVRCSQCRKNICLKQSVTKLIKSEEIYREAAIAMQEQKTQMAIDLFKEGIDLFFEIAALPHKDTIVAQESLRACLADTGTTFTK